MVVFVDLFCVLLLFECVDVVMLCFDGLLVEYVVCMLNSLLVMLFMLC